MNAKDFTNILIDEYQQNSGRELSFEDLGLYLCEIIESNSNLYLAPLNKKTAARIIHEFIRNVSKIKDVDWGDATKFSDIYECRVCANSLAQCYVRGIIKSQSTNILGINNILSDEEVSDIISHFGLFLESHPE